MNDGAGLQERGAEAHKSRYIWQGRTLRTEVMLRTKQKTPMQGQGDDTAIWHGSHKIDHLEVLAADQTSIDIDRTEGNHAAFLKVKVKVLQQTCSKPFHVSSFAACQSMKKAPLQQIRTEAALYLPCNSVKIWTLCTLSDFAV